MTATRSKSLRSPLAVGAVFLLVLALVVFMPGLAPGARAADVGVEEVLSVSRSTAERVGWFALIMLALGGLLVLGAGWRRNRD